MSTAPELNAKALVAAADAWNGEIGMYDALVAAIRAYLAALPREATARQIVEETPDV